jgi:hypothetical protein
MTPKRISFADYIKIEAVSASQLNKIAVSPRHYRRGVAQDTASLHMGRAAHTAVLEPDRFLLEYAMWPDSHGRRYGKKWDEFQTAFQTALGQHRSTIREKDYLHALKIRDAVREHPVASPLLRKGAPEETILWTHPRTGLPCKSRLDWVSTGVLVDLKTTRDPSPRAFASSAVRYGYHRQLAFYADALATTGQTPAVKIIAAQNVEPFDVVVYAVPPSVLVEGARQNDDLIDVLIKCRESNTWPGVEEEREIDLVLPAWALEDSGAEPLITFNGEDMEL